MSILNILVLFSGLSFLAYGIAYFTSPRMKSEFLRFGLGKLGLLTAVLEILGAIGLLIGLLVNAILMISSGGLALLMFLGLIVRIKVQDRWWASFPALFFMLLNAYIFGVSMQIYLD
jgi:hypothetical protein